MKEFRRSFRELLRYPSAIVSLVLILLMVLLSVYTVITIPYNEAIRLWRGSEEDWYKYPRQAAPVWMNAFSDKKQPVSFFLNSADGTATKEVETREDGTEKITITYTFDYQYDDFPQELILYTTANYESKKPLVSIHWITPDERELNLASYSILQRDAYRLSQDDKLSRILRADPMIGLFADPANPETPIPLKGTYQMVVTASVFEPDVTLDAELVEHGTLYGLAGTDFMRRDLMIALMWGMPIALAFGLAGGAWVPHHNAGDRRNWHLVRRLGGRTHPTYYRDQFRPALPAHPDHDRHVLFAQYLVDTGRDHPAEHFWPGHQELQGGLFADQRITLYRSRPRVWSQRWAYCDPLPDSARYPAPDPATGDAGARLCLPGSSPGCAWVG